MAFQIKRRGRLTYYYRDPNPSFSYIVTDEQADGNLRVYLAGLAGGESAARQLGLPQAAHMDPAAEIPLVFRTWESWLREAGLCQSLQEIDFIEMHVFGCQPKTPSPVTDPAGYSAEVERLRKVYTEAYARFFRERLPDHGLPVRFTVHVVDVPDRAASYEFYTTGLLQRPRA